MRTTSGALRPLHPLPLRTPRPCADPRSPCVAARVRRWVRVKWFQYEITFGSYCFEWWEKAMIHLLVLGVVSIFAYGIWRQALVWYNVVNGLVDRFAHRQEKVIATWLVVLPRCEQQCMAIPWSI